MADGQVLRIRLQQDDQWPPFDCEEVYGEPVGEDRYRIASAPAFAKRLSVGDVVTVRRDSAGEPWVQAVVSRGGHSTIRVNLLRPELADDLSSSLATRGCQVRPSPLPELFTVDVPEAADYADVRRYLEAGENTGDWEFQEAAIALHHDTATSDAW